MKKEKRKSNGRLFFYYILSSINRGGKPSQMHHNSAKPSIVNSCKSLCFSVALRELSENEGIIFIHCNCIVPCGCGVVGQSRCCNGSNMQPNRTKPLCRSNNFFNSSIHNMLHQDQATEALPLPVSQQPQPQEVCQHPKCQESC